MLLNKKFYFKINSVNTLSPADKNEIKAMSSLTISIITFVLQLPNTWFFPVTDACTNIRSDILFQSLVEITKN